MTTFKNIMGFILNLLFFIGNSYVTYQIAKTTINLNGYKDEHVIMEGVCTDLDTGLKIDILAEQVTITEREGRMLKGVLRAKGVNISCSSEHTNIIEKIGVTKHLPKIFQKENEVELVPIVVRDYDETIIRSLKNQSIFVNGDCTDLNTGAIKKLNNHPMAVHSITPVKDMGVIQGESFIDKTKIECDISKVTHRMASAEEIQDEIFKRTPTKDKVGQIMSITGECKARSDIEAHFSGIRATLISYDDKKNIYHFIVKNKGMVASVKCEEGMFTAHTYREVDGEKNEKR